MKKLFLTTGLMFAFVGLAQAELPAPTFLKPDNATNLPLKKAAKFTWQKVTGASKYRLIFSNDRSFANYDANKFKCLNAKTCFLYTIASPSYNVAASHPMLKANGNYFWQIQSVGKAKTDNSKMSEIRSFSVGTPPPPTIQSVNANPQQITLGASTTIKATLDRALAVGFYTIKISIDDGEPQAMMGVGTDFYFNFNPTESGDHQFQIDIFDVNGESVDSNGDSFTVILESSTAIPVTSPSIVKTTGYTKIANNGSELPDSALLGTNPTDWACTKDNETGLTWEIKTNDGGFRDAKNLYTWDYAFFNFAADVNSQSLCGKNDWRLPTNEELKGLVYCSDGKYNALAESICTSNEMGLTTTAPTINPTYFPYTKSNFVWTSSTVISPVIYDGKNPFWVQDSVFLVGFDFGRSVIGGKSNGTGGVRLVRDGK
jgi:hypothetical protein